MNSLVLQATKQQAIWWDEWYGPKILKVSKATSTNLPIYQSMIYGSQLQSWPQADPRSLPGPTGHAVLFRNRPWPGRGPKEVATGKKTVRFQVSVQHCLGPHGCHKHRYKHLPETVDPMAIDHLGNFVFFQRFDVLFGTSLNPCMIRWFWWWIIFQHI